MNKKQNTTNHSNNENSSPNRVTQDIFVKPIMTSETRGKNSIDIKMKSITEGVELRRTTFSKDKDN